MSNRRGPRPSELAALLETAIRGAATPVEMSRPYRIDRGSMSSRLGYMRNRDWIERRAHGVYRLTDPGWTLLRERVDVELDAILAYRVFDEELTTIGKFEVVAIRLASGEVATFGTPSALDLDDVLGLELELRERYETIADVEDVVDAGRPDA